MKVTIDGVTHQNVKALSVENDAAIAPTPTPTPTPTPAHTPTPTPAPVTPPAGVQAIEVPLSLALSSATYKGEQKTMGKNQQFAFKFAADELRGKILVIQNSRYSIAVSISANPHDYGPLDATQGQRNQFADTFGNGGGGDKTFGIPATFNAPTGFIYVNVRWPVWNNFPPNGKLVNYALDDSGTFVIRKDA